jgi:hypothetical protein
MQSRPDEEAHNALFTESHSTEICLSPAQFFATPQDVMATSGLRKCDKLRALVSWEAEERLRQSTAPRGHDAGRLRNILACQRELANAS